MAFARFARDSIDRDWYSPIRFVQTAIVFLNGDRFYGNSLASRVNAIDPYEIFRHPKHLLTIVNILVL